MNLYAIKPDYSPGDFCRLAIGEAPDALIRALAVEAAVDDLLHNYGSPTATVFLVGPLTEVATVSAGEIWPSRPEAEEVHRALAEQS